MRKVNEALSRALPKEATIRCSRVHPGSGCGNGLSAPRFVDLVSPQLRQFIGTGRVFHRSLGAPCAHEGLRNFQLRERRRPIEKH